jgi:Holliday junction resolvase RusA-like endonuclease
MKFTVCINPVGQMRARHGTIRTKSGKIISKTFKHDTQAERETTLAALLAPHVPAAPLEGPLALRIRAVFRVPDSWSQKKKVAAVLQGSIRPTGKPDLDNVLKHVKDVMTDLCFWKDDAQVVEYLQGTGKYYGLAPRIEVEIIPAELLEDRA